MFKGFVLPEFNNNKCNSLFLIKAQETFVNSVNVFELKNYFTTLFQVTMSCFIGNYYIF